VFDVEIVKSLSAASPPLAAPNVAGLGITNWNPPTSTGVFIKISSEVSLTSPKDS
jgi:hypothetical protein